MSSLKGFIKLHRKLVAWGWYQDNPVKCVFLHLLLIANFTDAEWRGRTLKAGQLVTSIKKLSADLGFSEQQIRTALEKLKSTREITVESTNRFSIITVVNWEEYQSDSSTSKFDEQIVNKKIFPKKATSKLTDKSTSNDDPKMQNPSNQSSNNNFSSTSKSTSKSTNKQQTSNKQITNKQQQRKNNKNIKNDKNGKNSYARARGEEGESSSCITADDPNFKVMKFMGLIDEDGNYLDQDQDNV